MPGEALALVTSLNGGRLPLTFCGGTLPPLFMAGLEAFFGSMFGRVSGLYDEVDGPRDKGLPGTPGAPTRRWMSVAGLT